MTSFYHIKFIAATLLFIVVCAPSASFAQTTHPDDLTLWNQIITNHPTTWGALSGWEIGSDPCVLTSHSYTAAIQCNYVAADNVFRITQITARAMGAPLTRKLAGPVPAELFQFPYLEALDISFNNLTGTLYPLVSTSLYTIDVSENFFTGSVPASFYNQPNLAVLNVGNNMLSGNLPTTMLGAPFRLDFYANQFTGPLNIQFNKTLLTRFNANDNQLSGQLRESFFADAPRLNTILLNLNKFSGFIPESLAALPNLNVLDLSSNSLSGVVPDFQSVSLNYFVLSGNKFTGPIPQFLAHQNWLTVVALNCNQFSGSIPDFFGSLPSLQFLRLEVNDLSGALPSFLQVEPIIDTSNGQGGSVAKNLNFNATCNNFYGPLPQWCSDEGDGNGLCAPCTENLRSCMQSVFISQPGNPNTPTPTPEPEASAASSLSSRSSTLRFIIEPLLHAFTSVVQRIF